MKHPALLSLVIALAAAGSGPAAIIVPGANSTDGTLDITANTVIDLSLAPTGIWDQDNTANAGKGVYDPQKWAVVFKYTSVNVASGATVTFKNHPSRAPVVWLVSGDVTIAGTVSLDGQGWVGPPHLAEPGPGGFRGGMASFVSGILGGAGFGPGGSGTNTVDYGYVGSGSYGSVGRNGPSAYGNPSLVPLLGGSGGAGSRALNYQAGGGGGGGAILIASSGQFALTGTLRANGGDTSHLPPTVGGGGAGSGGGIRIVAQQFTGGGSLRAIGGSGMYHGPSANGRIRLERINDISTVHVQPAPSVIDLDASTTAILWPPAGSPEVRVVSVGENDAPEDPRSAFGTLGADVALPSMSSTTVIVETKNVEPESLVSVRITPRDNANFTSVTATRIDPPVSESPLTYHWSATVPTNLGYSAIQAHVVRP